ncbi:unnamed protein product [Durusdinium trenchii]|uniref:Fibronectin type-III domain-containing protein n=2 Tax=Durusdinium trenchii TaxID=1381693 RepID=A0ABP0S3A2_9DINO
MRILQWLIWSVLLTGAFGVGSKLSLVCSGISQGIPGRVSLFFLSREPLSGEPTGTVKVRDAAGVIYEQEFAAARNVDHPTGISSDATLQSITGWIRDTFRGCTGKTGLLLDLDSSTSITCYTRYPDMAPLDKATDGSSLHVVALGEVDPNRNDIIPDVAPGPIRSIWAIALDGISPGWLGLSQQLDPPAAMVPCPDAIIRQQTRDERVIHPCSLGRTGRWIWFQVAPAEGRQDCASPPNKNIKRSTIRDDKVQAFCSNVPDGFVCPVRCERNRAPTGIVRCLKGKWVASLRCRTPRHACLAPLKTVTVSSANGQNSWNIQGIVPDTKADCDLFTRHGKKCAATCSGGNFGSGQVKCHGRWGKFQWSYNDLATYEGPLANGIFEARNKFKCNSPSLDTLFPRPLISTLETQAAEETTIKITAVVPREPDIVRSCITTFYFREVTGRMTCTTERSPTSVSQSTSDFEADDPENNDEDLTDPEVCANDEFTQQDFCLNGGYDGLCWRCLASELTTRDQCWRGRTGVQSGQSCGVLAVAGDFYTCRFGGFTQPQQCFTAPPLGYCVKKICAYQGTTKYCTEFDPPTFGPFCVGDETGANIDHAVIKYTCCDHNVITYTGYCSGGVPEAIAKYEIMVGAKNDAGTSWSLPVSITCADLHISGPDAVRYVIPQSCSGLLPGATCKVTCGEAYITQSTEPKGIFTCQNGKNEQPFGELPVCRLKPGGGGKIICGPSNPVSTTTTTTAAQCAQCAAFRKGWKNSAYTQCRAWGDPHISKSWRQKKKFNHQGTGVFRYATSNACAGGDFELQAFQCQYKSTRNSVITSVKVQFNGGDKVFITENSISLDGSPAVEPSDAIHNDKAGVNIHSDDKCMFLHVNVKKMSRNPGFMHNFKLLVWEEDLTAEGICGAQDLKNEYVAPDSGKMLFTPQQHTDLCNQCINSGGNAPQGCVTSNPPPTISFNCDFLAPLDGRDTECKTSDHALVSYWQTFGGGKNCVVYTMLRRKKSCGEYCREKGSECVGMVDDPNSHDCTPKNKKDLGCSTKRYNDAMCVCKIPSLNVPGAAVVEACQNSEDGLTVAQAEAMCKVILALVPAFWPARNLEPNAVVTEEEEDMDSSLEDCMIDVCSSGPLDRPAIIDNLRTELSGLAARGCSFVNGLQYELGLDAYPCNCGGVNCEEGQACLINGPGGPSCAAVPTTITVTTMTDTVTSTSESSTSSTYTTSSTTFTVPPLTTLTSTSTSRTSSTTTTMSSTSTTSASSTSTLTTTTKSSTTSVTSSSTTSKTSTQTSITTLTTSSVTSTSSMTLTSTSRTTTSSTSETSTSITTTGTTVTDTVTSITRTWTDTTSTLTSSSSTATTVTTSSFTETSTSATETTMTTSSSTASTISTTWTKTSTTTMTTTTTYPLSSFCGPWNPVGGFAEISWNGGDFPALAFDGNGWEWRVFLKSTVEGSLWFLLPHCLDIRETTCHVYCLEPGASYDVRVELVATIPTVSVAEWQLLDVAIVPPARADPPEDLQVVEPQSHALIISWAAAAEQGNCTFRSWRVEIKDPAGGWLVDPPSCAGLSNFQVTRCTLANLPCDTGYIIQVKQQCDDEESTSDWSRPITANTLVGGDCADPAQQPQGLDLQANVQSSDGGRRLSTDVNCQAQAYVLQLVWLPGQQEDSQFLVWHVELYKLTIVAGQIDRSQDVQIPDVCKGLLDRANTRCFVPDLAFGLYSFAVQEISMVPATSSPLSATSLPVWVPRRRAAAPVAVQLSEATVSGARIAWSNAALEDCIFTRTKVEVSSAVEDWFEPEGCRYISDPTSSSCSARGLQSSTAYIARVLVLCDECTNTPSSQRVACQPEDAETDVCRVAEGGTAACFKKLSAFRASSCWSASSGPLTTLPRKQAVPTGGVVTVPSDSGVRVSFSWIPGVGSASNSGLPPDCNSQNFQLEIKAQSESDWGSPEGCQDLASDRSCTALNLQCDTLYDARIRAACVPAAASSDWMAFPSFRTAYAGICLRPASPPQLLRATQTSTVSLEVSFSAGSAGDCVFQGFELQMRQESVETWTALPLTSGSLQVRSGPSCLVQELSEGTGYYFRARELCSNGAPLASGWGNTEEALRTTSVPVVQQPSFIDPQGFLVGQYAPQRLMLFFDTDLALGDSSVALSICPSLPGTVADPGACNCVSVADCASKCVTRDVVQVLLQSSRVALVDFAEALPRPLTSCPYDVIVEEGLLKTQLTPAKLSPRITWSFTYSPPPPIGMVTLHSSTTTSMTVRVTWDRPMTVRCGVASEAAPGGIAQLSEPEDFTGARDFVEVPITGLLPFTQYSVVCTGAAIGDPILTSTVSTNGVSTKKDTDDTLSDVTLNIKAVCNDESETEVFTALYPPFDPTSRNYQVTLNADEVRTWCSPDETEAVLRVEVLGQASSAFALVQQPEVQSMVQQLLDANGELPPEVPRSANIQVVINVHPAQTGDTAPAPYTINFVLGVLDVSTEVGQWPSDTVTGVISYANAPNVATFEIAVPTSLNANYIGLRLGPYEQTVVLASSQAIVGSVPPRTLHSFRVDNLWGLGTELPLVIQIQPPAGNVHPTLDVYTDYNASFDPPTVTDIETDQENGTVSNTQITYLTVYGTNLMVPPSFGVDEHVGIFLSPLPNTCSTNECQERELQRLLSSGAPNLCMATVVSANTQETSVSCFVTPSASGALGLCLTTRRGFFSELYCAAFAPPGLVQPEQEEVVGIDQPLQDMSSPTPFIITVGGALPPENVTQGFLQVWGSPFDVPPVNISNPGPGHVPLCSDAVRIENQNNSLLCYRNTNFNVSEMSANPNVFIQTGPDQTSSNVLTGGLTIGNPQITQIIRSHEFEVGEMTLTVEGTGFGTNANGNLVVSLESFGPRTPEVRDIRLAENLVEELGAPDYVTNCQIVTHEDTRIESKCVVTSETQSVLGAEVNELFYREKVEEEGGGNGRRLQQDLTELALKLTPLPVAITVSYELDCTVLERLNETCGQRPQNLGTPMAREWQTVRLKPCPAGEHRINYTGSECLQCQPGKFKSGVGPALLCDLCDQRSWMGLAGAGACTVCPQNEATGFFGATEIADCDCQDGYYRLGDNTTDWRLESSHGVCGVCPTGAICEGGPTLPYSAPGYWTPDRLRFWPCFPTTACLEGSDEGPNLCQEGREPTSVRCGQCAYGSYAHNSECHICSTADDLIAWLGMFLFPILIVCVFIPLIIRHIRSSDMSRTKKSKRIMAHKRKSKFGGLGDVDHGEFRMLLIMWTSLQMLWIVSLMPLQFTSFAESWLWGLGMSVFDFSIFRPQCAFRAFSYFVKWLTQWGLFFIMSGILAAVMFIYCARHLNRHHDPSYISMRQGFLCTMSATLMLLLLVHLRDDLVFLQCVDCEDGKQCLAEQPVIYCWDFTDWEWTTMAILSSLDLLVVILASLPIVALSIYKSWKWQHGDEIGLSKDFLAPWYVFFAEDWVRRHQGYITEVREAVPEFEQAYKDLHAEGLHLDAWSKAIDIILAQEAEKAEVLLRKIIRHLYAHHPRFSVIDEDEGPTFQIIRNLVRSSDPAPVDEDHDRTLHVSDVHHITIALFNLLDTARHTVAGARIIKRWLAYSWSFMLLLFRFAILLFAMLMRRDQKSQVPLPYMLTNLALLISEATVQPYQWNYLNDWELTVHTLIYVFMLFVHSEWSDVASDVLLVVATAAAILPVILRIIVMWWLKDKSEDPTHMTVKGGEASYHLSQLVDGGGTRSLGVSTTTTESIVNSGTLEHVRKSIELVKKKQTTVVEKTYDDWGQVVERTIQTEETETENIAYSLDMTKSRVEKVMRGQPDDHELHGLAAVPEDDEPHVIEVGDESIDFADFVAPGEQIYSSVL